MQFVLDNDVDAEVGRVLRQLGHQCVTASMTGMAEAKDDAWSVFADNLDAVLLSHDVEFADRRKRNTFGRHVLLACRQWEAVDAVKAHLDTIIELAYSRDAILIKVSRDSVRAYPTRWE